MEELSKTEVSDSLSEAELSFMNEELEASSNLLYSVRDRKSWWARRSGFWKFIIICATLVSLDLCIRATIFFVQRAMILDRFNNNKAIVNVERYKTRIGDCFCGHSIAEAQALGCIYDLHAIAWMPPACTDFELMEEFNNAGELSNGRWGYYADRNGTIPLTDHEVSLLADTDDFFYATHAWHLVHCNFAWRKLFRSQMNGVVIERTKLSEEHISHCGMLEGPKYHHLPLDVIATKLRNSLHEDLKGGSLEHVE